MHGFNACHRWTVRTERTDGRRIKQCKPDVMGFPAQAGVRSRLGVPWIVGRTLKHPFCPSPTTSATILTRQNAAIARPNITHSIHISCDCQIRPNKVRSPHATTSFEILTVLRLYSIELDIVTGKAHGMEVSRTHR